MDNISNIKIFTSEQFGNVRTYIAGDKVLFCGKDVATALGYTNTNKALKDHCRQDDLTNRYPIVDSLGRNQEAVFITEASVYRLVFGSKLPNAERFTDWVTEDILPTIRKTGGYVANADMFIETYLPMADENTKQLFRLTLNTVDQLNNKIREQSAQIERDAFDVEFAKKISKAPDCYSIAYLAKFLTFSGYPTGRTRLFDQLRNEGYLCRMGANRNQPTQKYCDMGLFIVQLNAVTLGDEDKFMPTTKVTGKGIKYFYRRYCAQGAKISDAEIDNAFQNFQKVAGEQSA